MKDFVMYHRRLAPCSMAALVVFAAFGASSLPAPVHAQGFQQNALFRPSANLLEAERKGHITIFDGVAIEQVDRALDNQFDRIASFMFVNTRYPESGEGETGNDDCD